MLRKPWFYLLVVVSLAILLVVFFRPAEPGLPEAPISTLIADVSMGRVSRIEIRGDELEVELKDLTSYVSTKEEGTSIFTIFADRGVDASDVVIEVEDDTAVSDWLGLVLNFLPILIFLGLIFYMMRQATKANQK